MEIIGNVIGEEVQMPIYKTILRRKEEIADGTMAFHFEKPEGFVFKAGQFITSPARQQW